MAYDPYEINLEEIMNIMHPSEIIKKMGENAAAKTKIRCKIFNIASEEEAEEYEKLITECANGKGKRLVKQETHFDRAGDYIVALHWEEEITK